MVQGPPVPHGTTGANAIQQLRCYSLLIRPIVAIVAVVTVVLNGDYKIVVVTNSDHNSSSYQQ